MNLSQIEQWFYSFSKSVPLELYTFVGSIIEEIIGVIPSPLVLTLAGSLALGDNKPLIYLFWLGIVGAAGKTFGGWVLYVIADKFEDTFFLRFGKWVGVSHQTVESIGKKFGKGKKDDWAIFVSRALPIIPSAAISVVCGVLKIDMKTYLVASFLGNYVRNMLYLYLGYSGIEQAQQVLSGIDSLGSIVKIVIVAIMVGVLGWVYYQRNKQKL